LDLSEESAAAGLFGNSLDFLKKQLTGTANTAIGLGGALLTGQQQLSAYSGALEKNTKAFGPLGSAVGQVVDGLTKFAESSLAEYQALTTVGATFNKEIADVKVAAAEMGMTVEDMTNFLQNNTQALRAFGGTTDQAIARFKALNTTILDSKELGMELRRLGFTTKDISEGLSLFGEITRGNANTERMSVQEQAASAKELMVQLDGLAKLTGKNRKELADEMRARRRQGDVNAFLLGKSAEEQKAFMDQLTTMQATMGQDAADAFVDIALRGAPTTEGARNAMLAMGDGADQLYTAAAQFNSGDIGAFTQSMIDARGAALDYQDTEEFRNTAILGSVTGVSDGFAKASQAAFDFKNAVDSSKDDTMTSADAEREIRTSIANEQLRQMEQTTGIFDKTMEIQENLRVVSSAVMSNSIEKIEGVAIAGLEAFQAALPSKEDIIAGINKGVDSLFDIAQLTDARNAADGYRSDMLNKTDTSIAAIETAGANVVNSNVEGAEKTTEATKTAAKETQEKVEAANEKVLNAQAELASATATLQEAVEAGMIPEIREARAAAEAAKVAAEAAAREQAAVSMKAAGVANLGGKTYAEGGNIPKGGFGIVGEAGPEFVSGPANVMSARTSMGVMQTLMKSIRGLDMNVQEVQSAMENSISTNNEPSLGAIESNKKLDTMISLLGQLIQVENMAVGTQSRQLKATKGLTGNMLRGV
jgi:hypothetical protein